MLRKRTRTGTESIFVIIQGRNDGSLGLGIESGVAEWKEFADEPDVRDERDVRNKKMRFHLEQLEVQSCH